MEEILINQSIISSPRGMTAGELLGLILAPLTKHWQWSEDEIGQWVTMATGKRKPLYITDETKRISLKGNFDKDEDSASRFSFEIQLSPEVGTYWTTTYIGVITKSETTLFQRTIFESTKKNINFELPPKSIGLPLKAAVSSGRFIDGGYPVISTPHYVSEIIDLQMLVDALKAPDRRLPILVIAEKSKRTWPIDPKIVVDKLVGIVHTVMITDKMTYQLSDIIGKAESVYQGYARMYTKNIHNGNISVSIPPVFLENQDSVEKLAIRVFQETAKNEILPPQIPIRNNFASMVRLSPLKEKKNFENSTKSEKTHKAEPTYAEPTYKEVKEIKTENTKTKIIENTTEENTYNKNPENYKDMPNKNDYVSRDEFDNFASEFIGRSDRKLNSQLQNIREELKEIVSEKILAIKEEFKEIISQQILALKEQNNKSEIISQDIEKLKIQITENSSRNYKEINSYDSKTINTEISEIQAAALLLSEAIGKITNNHIASGEKLNKEENSLKEIIEENKINSIQEKTEFVEENKKENTIEEKNKLPKSESENTNKINKKYPKNLEPKTVEKFIEKWHNSIILHPKAVGSLKNSQYERPDKVYAVLETLAENYVPMRKNKNKDKENYKKFTEKLVELNLRYEAYKESRGKNYRFTWKGKQRDVEYAIKSKNMSIDKKRCLRIYFIWDEDTEQLVLITLPSHLPDRI